MEEGALLIHQQKSAMHLPLFRLAGPTPCAPSEQPFQCNSLGRISARDVEMAQERAYDRSRVPTPDRDVEAFVVKIARAVMACLQDAQVLGMNVPPPFHHGSILLGNRYAWSVFEMPAEVFGQVIGCIGRTIFVDECLATRSSRPHPQILRKRTVTQAPPKPFLAQEVTS